MTLTGAFDILHIYIWFRRIKKSFHNFFFSLAAFPALTGDETQPGHLRLTGQVVWRPQLVAWIGLINHDQDKMFPDFYRGWMFVSHDEY